MGIARRRMRRRVLVAGAATGAAAYHAGKKHQQHQQDDQYDDQQPQDEPTDYAPAPPANTGPDASDLDQIAKLADLHKSGALTDEEFAVAKSKLLA